MEAMVSLIMLVVVMVIALSLLFTMKSFAERQQYATAPRQAARKAIDYLGIFTSGAADLNWNQAQYSPLAFLMYLNTDGGNPASRQQVSYNNLVAAQSTFGDVGTDILTMVVPTGVPIDIPTAGFPAYSNPAAVNLDFRLGCTLPTPVAGDDQANLLRFKVLTGWDGTSPSCCSGLISIVDANGLSGLYRITDYKDDGSTAPPGSTCASAAGTPAPGPGKAPVIHVTMVPGPSATFVDTPGGHPNFLSSPVPHLKAGIQIYSFRVKNGHLEQKQGPFDSSDPDTGFSSILDNVSDFQVAYIYDDGTIWNTGIGTISAGSGPFSGVSFNLTDSDPTWNPTGNSDGIPLQAGPCGFAGACAAPPACDCASTGAIDIRDITHVRGLRISITGRSNALPIASRGLTGKPDLATGIHVQPRSEDHDKPASVSYTPGVTPLYDYYRITTTLAIRNRLLKSGS